MSEESNTTPDILISSVVPKLAFIYKGRIAAKFKGNCLTQDVISYTQRNIVNLSIVYELDTW